MNKAYGEEGGDDIDFDYRQLCCPIDSLPFYHKNDNGVSQDRCECLDFGDDHFTIGSWEQKDFISRDG